MLPFLKKETNRTEKYTVQFRGLNYDEGSVDGELIDCTNLSSEKFPYMTSRRQRTRVAQYGVSGTLHVKEGLLVIENQRVSYNGVTVGAISSGRKQTATIGNYIVIFPDKMYYDTVKNEYRPMEEHYRATGLVFTENTITTTGNDWRFRVGDAVEISGCSKEGNNKTIIVRGVEGKVLTFYDYSFEAATEAGEVAVIRRVPDLEYICESNYRLWGVKDNTILGSKYGDPLNFFNYDGLSGDSYYIDVGSEGKFTGCAPYGSHICFFKENTLHKLYGSKPSNYQLLTSQVYGVQEGSERSICTINEQLIYKGVHGVYAYSGGIPERLDKFGARRFSDAAAATDGEKYYISMRSGNEWNLYVYDMLKGIWLREDGIHAVDLAAHEGSVYILEESGGLYRVDRDAERTGVEWSATFRPFNETMDERKGYSRFNMRVEMAAGSSLAVEVKADHDRDWRPVYDIAVNQDKAGRIISIPIIPTRTDSISIRVSGVGDCTIKALVREFTVGSDVI